MGGLDFLLMVTATILIAAAGYLSNDYFDIETDSVNKPEKQYIGKKISSGSTLALSLVLSFTAAILAVFLAFKIGSLISAGLLLFALFVTWWYAILLKKSFLWGNIAVSCMSAGTIAMAWIIEKQCSEIPQALSAIITKVIVGISVFAFLLSLMREIVKDMEDIKGDKLIGCHSVPLVRGVEFTKKLLQTLAAITFVFLFIAQVQLYQYSRYVAVLWLFVFVEMPLAYFAHKLGKAVSKQDFHKLSSLLKWIMLGGMGSIIAGQI
jgi:4-hydroxybenzoate polyprenyltransferase